MFNFIRTHQRIVQVVLLVLILPSFVLIGVSGYNSFVANDEALVEIDGNNLTSDDFDYALREQIATLQRQYGADFDPAVMDSPESRRALLDQLINQRVLFAVLKKRGLNVSDEVLRNSIAEIPAFQNAEGQFSIDEYYAQLEAAGLSVTDFEQSQRTQLALGLVLDPIADNAQLPSSTKELLAQVLNTGRTVALLEFNAAELNEPLTVSEADLQTWYEQHKAELALPQYVDAEYLLVNEDSAKASVGTISESDLQAYYEQNIDEYRTPARAELSYILLLKDSGNNAANDKTRDQAVALAKELHTQPQRFAELAREHSDDAASAKKDGYFGWLNQSKTHADAIQQSVFALSEGEISDVVEGPNGYHIFRMDRLQPETRQSFEEVKAQLEDEVRTQLAAERFAEMTTQLTNLVYEHPESLEAAANTLQIPLKKANGISRDGLVPSVFIQDGQAAEASADAALFEDGRVRRALFTPQALNEKHNAGVVELSADQFIALRVSEVHPENVPEFEQVKAVVTERVQAEQASELALQKGQAALEALQHNTNDTEGFTFGRSTLISRFSYPEHLPKALIDQILLTELDANETPKYVGAKTDQGFVVAKVLSVEDNLAGEELIDNVAMNLQAVLVGAEQEAAMQALRQAYHVKELPDVQKVLVSSSTE